MALVVGLVYSHVQRGKAPPGKEPMAKLTAAQKDAQSKFNRAADMLGTGRKCDYCGHELSTDCAFAIVNGGGPCGA